MLSYFGHIARRKGNNLEKVIMQGMIEGNRRKERPRSWCNKISYYSWSYYVWEGALYRTPSRDCYTLAEDRHRRHELSAITTDMHASYIYGHNRNEPTTDIGEISGDVDISPPIFDKGGGDGICNHPPNVVKSLQYFVLSLQIWSKSTDFALKRLIFNDSSKIYQQFPPNYKILVSQAHWTVSFLLIACSKFAPKSIHQIAWF